MPGCGDFRIDSTGTQDPIQVVKITALKIFRTLLTVPALVFLAGCQLLEPRPDEPDPDAPVEAEAEAPEPEPPRLSQAIDELQDGRNDSARDTLERYLAEHPQHPVAQRLLDQLDHPPEHFLGVEFIEMVVQPGDTLSAMAAEHAGDSLLFVALARLNGVQRPRLLQPGTSLRVPAPATSPDPEPEVDSEQTALEKIDAGEPEQGLELLAALARADDLSTSGFDALVETGIKLSSRALAEGEPDVAADWLERIQPWVSAAGAEQAFNRQQARIAARQTYESARLADSATERRALLLRALELDPDYAAAAHVLEGLETDMVEDYHEQALRVWRRQEYEQAAELWKQVLEIDPEFEPARVYLERAREILDRLESL